MFDLEHVILLNTSNNDIFYHMFCVNDSVDRFSRTYRKIVDSNLINHVDNIYVNCVGSSKIDFSNQIKHLQKVRIIIGNHHKDESETLNLVLESAKKNKSRNTLYLHSKGCYRNYHKNTSEFTTKAVQSWIDCMEYFLIEQYSTCLDLLHSYDNCGINLLFGKDQTKGYRYCDGSGYSGNFWWARNSYISTLHYCSNISRWHSEFGFLLPKNSRYKELYKYTGDPYQTIHDKNNYYQCII